MDKVDAALMDILKQNQKLVEQYINKNSRENIDYEQDFEKISKKNISNRDNSYTDLLEHFVLITRWRNILKEIHKWIYFWIIMALTVLFGISIFKFLSHASVENDLYDLIAVISSLISFSSVIISIPLIITKYLFSSKEDKRIASIISHTQKHDLNGKKMIRHLVDKELSGKSKETIEHPNEYDEMMELVDKTFKKANDFIYNSTTEESETQEQD